MTVGTNAVTFFTRRLRRAGSAARAKGEKAYLKSELRFWGTGQEPIRAAVRDYCDAHPDLTRGDLRAIAETMYATDVHELRASAIGVLERNSDLLVDRDLPWLITLVRRSKSWAYVDWLAPKVIGDVIARDGRSRRRLSVWAKDDDFWVRRAALWSRLAATMLEEREFFIRKAIGWVLREVSKKRPELTYEFLRKHKGRVSRLSLQEGAKYLPGPRRKALGLPSRG